MPITFDESKDYEYLKELCPECGGLIRVSLTCHTYPQNGRWVSCLPCASAYLLECWGTNVNLDDPDDEGCGWSYTWGLNPRNPRSLKNEEFRPLFIAPGEKCPCSLQTTTNKV